MKTLLSISLLVFMGAIFTPDAHAVKLGTRIKAAFGNKDAKKEVAEHRAEKQEAKAKKACEKGKARKCERLTRKAAANRYAAETGDFKGKRQMKRRDRKLRRAKKACRKGKQRKCDRLTRKAAKHDCLLNGNSRKHCRQQKRRDRKAQRAYRKGFSDVNVTEGLMNNLNNTQKAQRNYLLGGAGAAAAAVGAYNQAQPSVMMAFQLSSTGCNQVQVNPAFVDGVNVFQTNADCLMGFSNLQANNCASQGGSWNGQFCQVAASRGIASEYSKASRFVPDSSRASSNGAARSRSVIKGSVNGGGAQRSINTFGAQVNSGNSESVSGSLNGN